MKNKLIYIIIILSVLFSTCKKDELKLQKLEISSETVVKGTTSAQITVNYSYPTNLKRVDGYVSTMSSMTVTNKATAAIDGKTFVVKFQDLEANTTYYYQFEYSNGIDEIYTEVKSFTTNDYNTPTVTTSDVTNITAISATCGGNVTDDGGFTVAARGVCWSTSPNPTINDSHTTDGIGTGEFQSYLTNLSACTTYYVRAYATNEIGTAYGEQKTFKPAPEGAIGGLFSVSATQKVLFSQGNLQYQASTNTWRFAENQWDYVGHDNSNISSSYSGWIDWFGWGTGNNPTNSSTNNGDYNPFNDWGNNAISNGGNTANAWRTLTHDTWVYVFNTRSTPSGIRYAKATVNGINGVILLPDDWNSSHYSLSNTNVSGASYSSNNISQSNWTNRLEANGAVFLPAAGFRGGTSVYDVGSGGRYWSASYVDSDCAHYVSFYDGYLDSGNNRRYRRDGLSVRLVSVAE